MELDTATKNWISLHKGEPTALRRCGWCGAYYRPELSAKHACKEWMELGEPYARRTRKEKK